MSVDGYIAAPNDNPEQGLGDDGMRLHDWVFDDPSVFERVYGNLVEETGAVIMGRRSYDNSIELSQTDGVTHLEYRVRR
jgi:dihydrofolate reductase